MDGTLVELKEAQVRPIEDAVGETTWERGHVLVWFRGRRCLWRIGP